MSPFATNIRYILWRSGAARDQWASRLAELLGCEPSRAEAVLAGTVEALLPEEQKKLAHRLKVSVKELSSPGLLTSREVDILGENIRYLVNTLPYGKKKEFAAQLGIDVTTVSRWVGGLQRPTRAKFGRIARFFSLPAGVDLGADPIFLSMEPVSELEMKARLHEAIDNLDGETLRTLYPVLARLVKR